MKFIGKESIFLTCKMGSCINDFPVAALTERLTEKKGLILYASQEARQSITEERTWQWACEFCLATEGEKTGSATRL